MFRRVRDHWDESVSSVGLTLTIVGYLWSAAFFTALVLWVLGYFEPRAPMVGYDG